jgi:uncharacterized protein YjbI with pentapeptide repeats
MQEITFLSDNDAAHPGNRKKQAPFLMGRPVDGEGSVDMIEIRERLRGTVLRVVEAENLRGAALGLACLVQADLARADMRGADLRHANLRAACLTEADLREADLSWANLCEVNLEAALLEKAILRCANLMGANLRGARLQGADLRDAHLAGADLSGADLREALIEPESLRDAILDVALPNPRPWPLRDPARERRYAEAAELFSERSGRIRRSPAGRRRDG